MFVKLATSIIVCFLSLLLKGQTNADEFLYWQASSRLRFADFKGQPNDSLLQSLERTKSTHRYGTIVTGIDVDINYQKGKTTYTIRAAMKRNASWIRYANDSISLRHEQGHLDICEIATRRLRQSLATAKSLKDANDIYERILKEEDEEHRAYDRENTHENGGITNTWQIFIKEELQRLRNYQQPIVVVFIDK